MTEEEKILAVRQLMRELFEDRPLAVVVVDADRQGIRVMTNLDEIEDVADLLSEGIEALGDGETDVTHYGTH